MIALWLSIGFVGGGIFGFLISTLLKTSKNDCENCLMYINKENQTDTKDN